jgi:hypothetical protein
MKTGAIPDGLKRVDQWVTWVFVQRPGQAKPGKLPIDRQRDALHASMIRQHGRRLTQHSPTPEQCGAGLALCSPPPVVFLPLTLITHSSRTAHYAFGHRGSLTCWRRAIWSCRHHAPGCTSSCAAFGRVGIRFSPWAMAAGVEIYSSDRYLTVTGALWGDSLTDLGEDKSATLAGWRQRIDAHAAQQAKAATPMTPAPSAATPADDQKLWGGDVQIACRMENSKALRWRFERGER